LPEASVVVVPVEVPARVIVTPEAIEPETVPEMEKVGTATAVKFCAVTFALLTVTDRFGSVKVKPVLLGVMV
jgi:hypothetical protein